MPEASTEKLTEPPEHVVWLVGEKVIVGGTLTVRLAAADTAALVVSPRTTTSYEPRLLVETTAMVYTLVSGAPSMGICPPSLPLVQTPPAYPEAAALSSVFPPQMKLK